MVKRELPNRGVAPTRVPGHAATMHDLERITACARPEGARQGFQRWDRLLFSHWAVPEATLRPLVDPRLTLDTFEGCCYVGLVPFTMRRVRPFDRLPSVPTATTFAEINLRTYVHLDGREPGVWFLSLEATSTLAVLAARALWRLPYFRASIQGSDDGQHIAWRARRRWPRPKPANLSVSFTVGAPEPPPQPGSLAYFLAERYQLYATRGSKLLRGRVHHAPYVLHRAEVAELDNGILRAAGLPDDGARTPDYFSPGVDAEIFPLRVC